MFSEKQSLARPALNLSSRTEPTSTWTGLSERPSTKALARQTADAALASQPFAAERDGFVTAGDAGVLILESLEHAEERNAEILAEIVFNETARDAISMRPPEDGDGASRLMVTVRDVAVVASVLILALLAGVWYQQDMDIRAARFSSRHKVAKRESAALTARLESVLGEKQVTNTATVEHPRSPQEQLTDRGSVVVVQPHDNLRRICLRYVGWYDARLVSKIIELNPELTDPNHITIGQHIVLPGSRTVGTTALESPAVPGL
jgi:LysM domain